MGLITWLTGNIRLEKKANGWEWCFYDSKARKWREGRAATKAEAQCAAEAAWANRGKRW